MVREDRVMRLGVNGFGRVGRLVTRIAFRRGDVEIVGINDPNLPVAQMAYLFKYDTLHGNWKGDVSVNEETNELVITSEDGKTKAAIKVFGVKTPDLIPWETVQPDAICESSGVFRQKINCLKHFKDGNGVKTVVMSAPPKHEPKGTPESDPERITKVFVYGVNHLDYDPRDPSHRVLSNASCSTNGLSPIARILQDEYGIVEGFVAVVHATTGNQTTIDTASKDGKDWRAGRAAALNIIPATTGAASAVALVVPELEGKLDGCAYRVPVGDVSLIDFCVRLERKVTYEELKKFVKAKAAESNGIIHYTEDMVVSSDFVGSTFSTIFDADAGMQIGGKPVPTDFFKLVLWYDNEYGYSSRLVDLAKHAFEMQSKAKL